MGKEQVHRKMITSVNKFVFYFDLSTSKQSHLPVFQTFIERYGAKHSTFLDKNVTHLVTDKASTIAEAYAKTCKWKMTLWSYPDFIEALLDLMEVNQDRHSAELLRKTIVPTAKNLNDCLAEEQKMTTKHKPSRLTPFYGGNNIINNCNPKVTTNIKAAVTPPTTTATPSSSKSKVPHFQPFGHPFMLIEEAGLCLASIYKQYEPTYSGRSTYPQLYLNTVSTHCPFVFSRTHVRPADEPAAVPVPQVEEKKVDVENVPPKAAEAENNTVVSPNHAAQTPRTKSKLLAKRSYQAAELNKKAYVPKPRPGYCECCLEKYEDLVKHIKTDYHRHFAGNASNYRVVDKVLQHTTRQMLYEYNPIPFWKNGTTASMMSPAHSCITSTYSKKGSASSSKLTPDKDLIEDKENDSPAGLDLTGVDREGETSKRKLYGFSSEVNDLKRRKLAGRKDSGKLGGKNLKNLFL